ncbi:SDR family NAD(P)-dependent oxidoreductase [Novosphingobium bradum]|uniref:SDR family NAD(P)-dependent oxidoreductase n=1 Tax=Novosphingobium bradum TaxID=1737444 RepID=A0ABV7IJB8_9SPHN
MMRFDGKVVVITGGAAGIGLATARLFHELGASVVIGDIRDALDPEAEAAFGGERMAYRRVDVADWDQMQALMDAAVEQFGGLDVLFNNAGIGALAQLDDLAVEQMHRVMDITFFGAFQGCKAAIPIMRARGGGAVINMASISGMAGDFGFAAYNAAKGAVLNFTRSIALENARAGVRVNAVCPGPIDTAPKQNLARIPGAIDTWEGSVPMGRFGTAEEVAGAVAFLASDYASYVTGTTLVVDGGMMAHTGQPDFTRLGKG